MGMSIEDGSKDVRLIGAIAGANSMSVLLLWIEGVQAVGYQFRSVPK